MGVAKGGGTGVAKGGGLTKGGGAIKGAFLGGDWLQGAVLVCAITHATSMDKTLRRYLQFSQVARSWRDAVLVSLNISRLKSENRVIEMEASAWWKDCFQMDEAPKLLGTDTDKAEHSPPDTDRFFARALHPRVLTLS